MNELQKAHLLIDAEKNPKYQQFKRIKRLNIPYYSIEQEAFRNRFNHLKRIKKNSERSLEYYRLCAAAQTLVDSKKKTEDPYYSPLDSKLPLSSDDDDADNEDAPDDMNQEDSDDSEATTLPIKQPETKSRKPRSKNNKMSGLSTSGNSRGSGGTRNTVGTRSSMGSPGGKARPLKQFETLEDAIDFVGHKNVIHVDWTRPEEHMAPIFFLHLATNCLNESKTAHFDQIRIWLPTIFDLRDLSCITGKNVVGGAAFLVSLPSVPWFMLKDHNLLHDDTKRSYCERTKLDHAEVANKIVEDEERCVTYYIFIMPEDTLCNADLEK